MVIFNENSICRDSISKDCTDLKSKEDFCINMISFECENLKMNPKLCRL